MSLSPIAGVLTFPLPLVLTGSALAVLVLAFVVWFLVPAIVHLARLRGVQRLLNDATAKTPAALGRAFAADQQLLHLWQQYADTLHTQTEDRDGRSITLAVRSTVPAEMFFNSQYHCCPN